MSSSILGQSGLGGKKTTDLVTTEPTGHTGQTGQTTTGGQGHERRTADADAQSPPAPPRRRPRSGEEASTPTTVYFWEPDIPFAADVVHALKKSGRLKGLVRGQIGISLVVAAAMYDLREKFEQNETAVIDRIVLMLSRRSQS